jgi:hypothetical protein
MTGPTADPIPPTAKPVSFWEDLIDILYAPSQVFERRRDASPWPPYLLVVIAMAIVTFATFPAIQPAIDGDMQQAMQKVMQQNPQITQEMVDKMQSTQAKAIQYGAGIVLAILVLIVGFLTWLVSKLFGAVESFSAAMLIVSYAYVPRVLGAVVTGVQGLLMDPTKLTSVSMLTMSPARFYDPRATNPLLLAFLTRLDVFIIWETVLLAIGVGVIGRISRGKAFAFGVAIWVVGGLYAWRNAYLLS